MSNAHVKNLLSEFLDEELGATECDRVRGHLKACAECREELEALKSLSRMLGDMPRRDLPTGFLTRLNAKRKAQEAVAPSLSWLPAPTPRLAALGVTCLLVSFVFYREVRYRLAPAVLPGVAGFSSLDEQMQGVDAEMTPEAIAAKRRAMVAKNGGQGDWVGLAKRQAAAAGSAAAEPAALEEAAAAPQPNLPADREMSAAELQAKFDELKKDAAAKSKRSRSSEGAAKAPGKPLTKAAGPIADDRADTQERRKREFTNADNAEFLAQERARLGIVETVTPGRAPNSPWDGIKQKPMSREEARAAMRRYARNLAQINEINRWKKAPTVPLGSGSTPRLIGQDDGFVAAGGAPGSSLAFSDAQPRLVSPAASNLTQIRGGIVAHGDDAMPAAPKMPAMREEAPRKPLQVLREWHGVEGGMPRGGAAVIKVQAHWDDLMRRVGLTGAQGPDFTKEMAVGVFTGELRGRPADIRVVDIYEQGRGLIVEYRVSPQAQAQDGKTFSGYHIIIVPKSDFPPLLKLIP